MTLVEALRSGRLLGRHRGCRASYGCVRSGRDVGTVYVGFPWARVALRRAKQVKGATAKGPTQGDLRRGPASPPVVAPPPPRPRVPAPFPAPPPASIPAPPPAPPPASVCAGSELPAALLELHAAAARSND